MTQLTQEQGALLQSIIGNQEFCRILNSLIADEKQGLHEAIHSAVMGANWHLAAQMSGKIQALDLFTSMLTNAARQSTKPGQRTL